MAEMIGTLLHKLNRWLVRQRLKSRQQDMAYFRQRYAGRTAGLEQLSDRQLELAIWGNTIEEA